MPRSTLAGKKEKDALSELTNKKRRKRASVGRDSWMGETSEGDSYVGSSVDETLAINAMDSAFGVLETMGEFGDKIGEAADVLPVTFGEAGINAVKNNLIGMTQSMLQSTGRKKEEGTVGKVISNAQKVVKQREYVVGENEFYSGGLGDAYGELATSCDNYINSHNPWTAVGKQRLAIVKAVRAQSKWERKMVLDHKQELAAEENKGKTFTEFIINCGEDVINKGLLDSRRDFNRKDIKTMPDWMLKEQEAVVRRFAQKFNLRREDAMLLADSRKTIDRMDKYLGGEGISDELIKKLGSQMEGKREIKKKYGSADRDPELQKRFDDTEAYMKKKDAELKANHLEVPNTVLRERDRNNLSQIMFYFLEEGTSEEALARNADTLRSLTADNKDVESRRKSWEMVIDGYLNFDLEKFDRRDTDYIMSNYYNLKNISHLGFVYERHIDVGLREAGFEIADEFKEDMSALRLFLSDVNGFIRWKVSIAGSNPAMYGDQEKIDDFAEVLMDRSGTGESDETINLVEIFSNDMAENKKENGSTSRMEEFQSEFGVGFTSFLNLKMSAWDILRKRYGWKSSKKPNELRKDIKIKEREKK